MVWPAWKHTRIHPRGQVAPRLFFELAHWPSRIASSGREGGGHTSTDAAPAPFHSNSRKSQLLEQLQNLTAKPRSACTTPEPDCTNPKSRWFGNHRKLVSESCEIQSFAGCATHECLSRGCPTRGCATRGYVQLADVQLANDVQLADVQLADVQLES